MVFILWIRLALYTKIEIIRIITCLRRWFFNTNFKHITVFHFPYIRLHIVFYFDKHTKYIYKKQTFQIHDGNFFYSSIRYLSFELINWLLRVRISLYNRRSMHKIFLIPEIRVTDLKNMIHCLFVPRHP